MGERQSEKKPVRRKAKPGPDETMASLRETRNTPAGRAPKRLGALEAGAGEVEAGFDEKRRQLHLAFLRQRGAEAGRSVVESSAEERRAMGVTCRSNDPRFSRGAVDLRFPPGEDADRAMEKLRAAFERRDCALPGGVLPLEHRRDGRALADGLKELVEPLRRLRRGGDDLPPLRKKREEEAAQAEQQPQKSTEKELNKVPGETQGTGKYG